MKEETNALANHYSSYLKGNITREDLMEWVTWKVTKVWQNDLPLLLLDMEFDNSNFTNPETALTYRVLNLEAARQIQSSTAIANTAFSASKAAVNGLNDLPTGLNLMLESLAAYLHTDNKSAAMMGFRNVLQFYNKGVSAENISYLNKYYSRLLEIVCKMPGQITHQSNLADASNITLDCLSAMHQFRSDLSLVKKTTAAFREQIYPFLDDQNKSKIQKRLNDLTT